MRTFFNAISFLTLANWLIPGLTGELFIETNPLLAAVLLIEAVKAIWREIMFWAGS